MKLLVSRFGLGRSRLYTKVLFVLAGKLELLLVLADRVILVYYLYQLSIIHAL